ncbi:MAG: glycosyl hydrolase family 18 [Blautia sp.]|nr:glycosyl hydrolase family 18 [Blautia sp.]
MRKKKRSPVIVVVLLIFLVACAGLATSMVMKRIPTKERMSLDTYYGTPAEGEAVLILHSDIMEKRAVLSGDTAYIPLGIVNTYINQRYYWDRENSQIIYASPTEVNYFPASENPGSEVWLHNEDVYLSIPFLQRFTDIDVYQNTSPNRIAVQYDFESLRMVKAVKNTAVRYQGGIKSPILCDVSSGSILYLLEELEKWAQVATPDGYIGYVRRNEISGIMEEQPARERQMPEYTYLTLDTKVNMVWHQITVQEANDYLTQNAAGMTGVNVISPTWYAMSDNAGNFKDLSSAEYVNTAHAMGLEVWALVDNFSPDMSTFEVLSHTTSRTNLINNLINSTVACGADGINIDLEYLSEETGVHFLEFLRELCVECHKNNLVLSVDNPVPEDFTSHYDRAEQGRVVDYVIIMGYDEHYEGSETPGSVASLPWVEQGIIDTIAEAPADRVINAVPFYTRIWKVMAESLTSDAVAMSEAARVISENNAAVYWDNELSQNVASFETDDASWQIWVEDAQSLALKADLVTKYNLAGIAAWKLGLEDSSVWQVITEHISGQ